MAWRPSGGGDTAKQRAQFSDRSRAATLEPSSAPPQDPRGGGPLPAYPYLDPAAAELRARRVPALPPATSHRSLRTMNDAQGEPQGFEVVNVVTRTCYSFPGSNGPGRPL